MKVKSKEIIRELGIVLIALIYIAAFAIGVIFLMAFPDVGFPEAMEIAVLATLVGVTYKYVQHTKKMSEEMKKQANIMLDGNYNAVAPVMKLVGLKTGGSGVIRIEWENVGMGPALNFRCWIEDEENPQLRSLGKLTYRAVVPTGNSPTQQFDNAKNVPTGIEDYELGKGSGYLRAQYKGIFGEKTYESCLMFTSPNEFELKYGEAGLIVDF